MREYQRGNQWRREFELRNRPSPKFVVEDGRRCVMIPLTQGKWTLILEESFPLVRDELWYFDGGYAVRHVGKKWIPMHRIIADIPEGMDTDHVNRNTLDNRISNLRSATRSQNNTNIKIRKDNISGVAGVWFYKKRQKWQVTINGTKKRKYIGAFDNFEDAVAARKAASKEHFGVFAPG